MLLYLFKLLDAGRTLDTTEKMDDICGGYRLIGFTTALQSTAVGGSE